MKKPNLIKSAISFLILSTVSFLLLFHNQLTFGTFSTKEINHTWIEIKREKYPLRNWKYSGIFPAGHFISDPHISSLSFDSDQNASFVFNEEIHEKLNDVNARYQGYDINYWFSKKYSETILAIESNSNIFEYKIILPKDWSYGFVNTPGKKIFAFLYQENLVFFTIFNISKPTFLIIPLPLRHNQNINITPIESEIGRKIITYLKIYKKYKPMKEGLCKSHSKIYIKFYENFELCN